MAAVKNLYTLLRNKYPENEYALMAEVSDASGFHRSNSADFIAVNLWPSRGLAINGIELKSSRGDWLNELKKPAKAENIFQYCDFFYLLTADETIAKLEEIPVAWGWMAVVGGKITTKKEAPKLAPIALSKHFVCAMLKRACSKVGFVHFESIEERIKAAEFKAVQQAGIERDHKLKDAINIIQQVKDFEESCGVKMGVWNGVEPKKAGEFIKFMDNGGVEEIKKQLERLKTIANDISDKVNSSLEKL